MLSQDTINEKKRSYYRFSYFIGNGKKLKEQVKAKTHKLIKGVWGMPRLSEAKKDVISCDKLWVVAHTL